jgi:hypothetical protein
MTTHRSPSTLALALAPRALAVLALATVACGPPPRAEHVSPADLRDISEARAKEIIAEVAGEVGTALQAAWPVDVGEAEPFPVDFQIASSDYGIEWVSPQDHVDHGETIPEPDPSGQLKIMPGAGNDAGKQVVVLDHRTYRYDPDLERVQRGTTGAREAESRLRRDVRDFLEYVRGQGGI